MAGTVPSLNERNPVRILQAIRDLFAGRSNAVGTVTLTAGAMSTAVTAINCGRDSRILLTPTTANAAMEMGAGTLYVSAVGAGTFTLTHAIGVSTDRTFFYAALG